MTTISKDPTLPAGLMSAFELIAELADPGSPAGQAEVLSLSHYDAALVLVQGAHKDQVDRIYALSRLGEAAGLGGVWITLGPAAWAIVLKSRHPGAGEVRGVVVGLVRQAGFELRPARDAATGANPSAQSEG